LTTNKHPDLPTGPANISGYEFSVDGGSNVEGLQRHDSTVPCTIRVGNIAGTVQVRAKETANYTGQIATSAAFTAALEGSVSITGTAKFGETLTANVTGAQKDAVFTYQWKADGTDISGATGKTYTSTIDRIGKTITVVVSAAPYVGTLTSAATAAVAKGDPTGTPAYKTVSASGKKLADAALAIGTLAPNAEGYS
jgi:predicted heme/steroid binding protein